MSERIKFYDINDLAAGHYVKEASYRLSKFDPKRRRYSINEIIELYNIARYIQAKVYLKEWTEAEKTSFYSSKSDLFRVIEGYFLSTSKTNFARRAKLLDYRYVSDFIALYFKYKLSERVSERQFRGFIKNHSISVRTLLANGQIVKTYPSLTKRLILDRAENAEILLDKYVTDRSAKTDIFLPGGITDIEKSNLVDTYIDSSHPNLNYLRLIKNVQNTKELSVSDRTRLKAEDKERELGESLFEGAVVYETEDRVTINPDQDEVVVYINEPNVNGKSFSKKWLDANTDNSTILQNFVHLFKYVDDIGRIDLLSDTSEMDLFESIMGIKARKDYPMSFAFRSKTGISTMEISAYYEFLSRKNVRLEDVISWFFSDYLSKEFGAIGFKITMPGKTLTLKEKCQALLPEIESVLKQFELFTEDGAINFRLLRRSQDQIDYPTIPSLVKRKYVYVNSSNGHITSLINSMFSTQSGLCYISESLSESTLARLLAFHKIKYSDFHSYQIPMIDFLIEQRILRKEKQYIRFKNNHRFVILARLFEKGFLNYPREKPELRRDVDRMIKEGLLSEGSTLLSLQEAGYFNYNLNKAQYTNGLNIRNQYSHGNQPDSDDEAKHRENYMIILKLLVLAIIKINDEFCVIDDEKIVISAREDV